MATVAGRIAGAAHAVARSRVWRVGGNILAGLGLLAAVLALVAYRFSIDWQPAVIAGAFGHQAMWGAFVALVVGVLLRRWPLALVAAVLSALVLLIQIPANIATDPGPGTQVTVLQANLKVGAADPGAVVGLVRADGVQLLATEELTTVELHRLVAAGLPKLLPYRYAATLPDGGGGLGMWSRWPLTDKHNLRGYQLGVLTARVPHLGATFVAAHLLPPYPSPAKTWTHEITALRTLLGRESGRVVVSGDFNATVGNPQFRALLRDGYGDAARQAGSGYGATYPSDRFFPPLIAIDHVLIHQGGALSTRTVSLPRSDHRGLLVTLRLR